MPSDIYKRKKHTKETKKKISESLKGKIPSVETRKKISESLKGKLSNEKNHRWKGDDVRYIALHIWVRKNLIKPKKCQHCNLKKKLQLANKSHEYKRDLNDWLWLCCKCHGKYDSGKNYGKCALKFPELNRWKKVKC